MKKVKHLTKEQFKAIVSLNGHIEVSIWEETMEDAMTTLLASPIFKLIEEADDCDIDIDVEKLWKVDA